MIMMMSIFSPFDMLFTESFVNRPSAPPPSNNQLPAVAARFLKSPLEEFSHFNQREKMMMMMSIFSPFDMLFAESFGQKVTRPWAPPPSNKQAPPVVERKIDDLNKGEEVSCSSQPPEERRNMRAPRFALELDGVHCFESILPY